MKLHAVLVTLALTASTAFAQDAGSGSSAPAQATDQKAAAPDTGKARKACEDAVAKPPAGDDRFVTDVQWAARGYLSSAELAKTGPGRACMESIASFDDLRSTLSTAADTAAAKDRDASYNQMQTDAAHRIAKDDKHVVLAYGALWLLAAGFLLFLWKRQQNLMLEIAQLKRDLDAATK
ncbi:hypothetical protein BH11MYX2_BH11MYX2_11750 [soil metagenome]